MGIDTHSLNFLRYATARHGPLGRTITLGRLGVFLGPRAALKWAGSKDGAYAEPMLVKKFGATQVDSIDNSHYEGATIIADMNQPIPVALAGQYDTVLDFGCTEHIFDVAQSMRNIAAMCRPGGMILHQVPANGYCGHGFYQFSPELFFSLYADRNGYAETEVYLADLMCTKHWYCVSPPTDGKRINVRSPGELNVMVITKRITSATNDIQQSDYVSTWADADADSIPAGPHRPGRFAAVHELLAHTPTIARAVHRLDALIAENGTKPLRRHPSLSRVSIDNVLQSSCWNASSD